MHRLIQYARYLIHSKGRHGVHSPFVYRLVEEVLNDQKRFYPFDAVEKQRRSLQKSNEIIEVLDLGAGSHRKSGKNRKVSDIATSALKRPKYARLLFRLINHCKYSQVLELGTSLGITTGYLAATSAHVVTLEGCPETQRIAHSTIKTLGLDESVTFILGAFDKSLSHPAVQAEFDLIFIDGHHIGSAMLNYYHQLRSRLKPGGCIVIDDINWSKDMRNAWQTLLASTDLNLRIDLFEMGLLIDRPEMEAQHFTLRY